MTEEDVTFSFGQDDLYGVLTLPGTDPPYPAVVLVSGSASTETGVRAGASSLYFVRLARKMALSGFAVLRYDPPGVGRSTGAAGFESLEQRTDEALAAVRYLQSRPDIEPGRVGLWGGSQGAWVIAMAAAASPDDVAFIISVSGSGVSVAEQQIYSIEAQSRGARFSEQNVAKAGLFGRLLIDWQLVTPIYREANETAAQALGDGPWTRFMALVYEPGDITPEEGLRAGIEVLTSIQDEPWAEFLYIKELYLPQLQSLSPEQVALVKEAAGANLLNDPREYLTKVRCPVLAVFGEDDLVQPTKRSAALYEQYLTEAGNENFTIHVLPGVGHSMDVYLPAYSDALSDWLNHLYPP